MQTERTSSGFARVFGVPAIAVAVVFLTIAGLPAFCVGQITTGEPTPSGGGQGQAHAQDHAQDPVHEQEPPAGSTSTPMPDGTKAGPSSKAGEAGKAGGAGDREKDVFVPSEKILADSVVPFPVDI